MLITIGPIYLVSNDKSGIVEITIASPINIWVRFGDTIQVVPMKLCNMFSSRRHDLVPKSELPSTLLIMDYVALILCRFDDVIFQIKMKEISFWFYCIFRVHTDREDSAFIRDRTF